MLRSPVAASAAGRSPGRTPLTLLSVTNPLASIRRQRTEHHGEDWSGRRDSNPRHLAWEASTLPTELLPLSRPILAPGSSATCGTRLTRGMPRTSSHTADRSSRPAARPTAGATLPAAADALEDRLVTIWEKSLARRPIGVDDNFFALNGNSLKAVRLCDRVWRETGHRVPPAILLESPTIATFAARLRQPDATRSGLIAVRTSGTKRPLFVAPGAGPRALYMRNLAEHLGAEQPLYLLQEPPGAAPGGADRSVEGLAQRFIVGMRRVQPRGPYDVVGISFGGLLAYEVARQLVADGEQVGLLALLDTRHPAFPRRRPSVAPGAFARRLANQVVIVRRVGRRRGGRYLRNRVRIGWSRSLEGLREGFASRLPAGPGRHSFVTAHWSGSARGRPPTLRRRHATGRCPTPAVSRFSGQSTVPRRPTGVPGRSWPRGDLMRGQCRAATSRCSSSPSPALPPASSQMSSTQHG